MSFPTTHWSLILASGDCDSARSSWAALAERYRAPIHAYFRARRGIDEADDLTNAFFAASIAGDWWARADIERGSFRTYLRVLLTRFAAHHAQTGAAGDTLDGETLADDSADLEAEYDRVFARALVDRALERLRVENVRDVALLPYVLERGDQGSIKQLAAELKLAQNSLSQRLRRLRLRLRELLREEFADLVADPAQIDSELEQLQHSLAR